MRVAVVGATGNVGTALLRRLRDAPDVESVTGVARRLPDTAAVPYDGVRWVSADVGDAAAEPVLTEAFTGVDAVVDLAWLLQPSWDEQRLRRVNVDGNRRVAEAAVDRGVAHVVYVSSVGTYAPHERDDLVDEAWPATGVPTSPYSRQKAAVEELLDAVEQRAPRTVLTRVRPGLVLQEAAGGEVSRYFLGAFRSTAGLLRRVRVPVVPLPPEVRFQVVHADDLAEALYRVLQRRPEGAVNVCAQPPLRAADIASAVGGRQLPVPLRAVRPLVAASWRLHLQPTDAGWLDLVTRLPLMSTERASTELGWHARHSPYATLDSGLRGLARGAGAPSPPLAPRS